MTTIVPYQGRAASGEGSVTIDSKPVRRTAPVVALALGVVILLIAMVFFAGSRLVASSQRHAYDPHAIPPPTYHLTAGKSYQLSSGETVKSLLARGSLDSNALSCTAASPDGSQDSLTIENTITDQRSLHLFANVQASRTGDVHVTCESIAQVFVDNADDAATDWSGMLVVLSTLLAVAGVALVMSGAYGYQNRRASS